ncbi:MAG: S41 family peptidase [Salibacteraceae bacterium]
MKLLHSAKVYLVILSIGTLSFLSYSFAEDYFGISKNLEIFIDVYENLNKYYVDDTNPGELMKTGIDAMLGSLDPYTNFYPESDIEDYRFLTTGQYGGIGSLIRRYEDHIVIAEPYEGFPAQKAGLQAGDLILAVDGKSTEGKTTQEMSKVLKGQPGTSLLLKVKRVSDGSVAEIELVRQEIKMNDVPYFGMLDEKTGYIKLNAFTETASREVKEAFQNLKDEHQVQKLVLDLRGNGGGLLREAVSIVNLFVSRGETVVETRGRSKNWEGEHTTLNAPMDTKIPLVVLIDEGSASASEIVSGALQDLDRAVVVGQESFGKGLVQLTHNLGYNAKLKITVAKYYIPSGRCIQRLDYSKRDASGKVIEVPDSLITEFTTRNGRKVYDGAGINPDREVPVPEASNILISLVTNNLIFEYANEFQRKHNELPAAKTYRVSNEEYDTFKQFLEGKEYNYVTSSEKSLESFEKVAKAEKYFDEVKTEFEALKGQIEAQKADDLDTYREEITELLENEIVSRYYYQSGRVEASLSRDPDVAEALKVINDTELSASIHEGTVAGK